jgi:hypothetical protein
MTTNDREAAQDALNQCLVEQGYVEVDTEHLVTGLLEAGVLRAGVPPQRPDPDDEAIYNDVKTELGIALGWGDDSDPDDVRDWRHDLVTRVIALTERAQRPGITRQQIRRELTIADARSPRDVDAALDRVWALLADSTTPEPEEAGWHEAEVGAKHAGPVAQCETCAIFRGATPPAPETQT